MVERHLVPGETAGERKAERRLRKTELELEGLLVDPCTGRSRRSWFPVVVCGGVGQPAAIATCQYVCATIVNDRDRGPVGGEVKGYACDLLIIVLEDKRPPGHLGRNRRRD